MSDKCSTFFINDCLYTLREDNFEMFRFGTFSQKKNALHNTREAFKELKAIQAYIESLEAKVEHKDGVIARMGEYISRFTGGNYCPVYFDKSYEHNQDDCARCLTRSVSRCENGGDIW